MSEELIPAEKPSLPIQFVEEKPENILTKYPGLSAQRFTEAQKAIIEQEIPPDDIDMLPTGELYVSQVRYRRILNDAFGPGGWAIVPTGDFQQDGGTLIREYSLFAEGRFISSTLGEADFQPNNPRYSKATAAESLKSNALTRCCKDLLIASECWDKRFCERWKKANAVAVWCVGKAPDIAGKKKKLWRRRDADRFEYPWAEQGQPEQPHPPEDVPSVDLRGDVSRFAGGGAPTPVPTPNGPQNATESKFPPVLAVLPQNQKFVAAVAELRKHLGGDIVTAALGLAGYSDEREILDRKTQTTLYKELEKLVPKDKATDATEKEEV